MKQQKDLVLNKVVFGPNSCILGDKLKVFICCCCPFEMVLDVFLFFGCVLVVLKGQLAEAPDGAFHSSCYLMLAKMVIG